MSEEIAAERNRRGLRKVKSLNLRSEAQLEKIAQGTDDLLNLMKLKKILQTGEVFDSALDTSEKGELLKNRLKLNAQARKSQKLPETPVLDELEEEGSTPISPAKKSDNKRSSGGPKKSSFREVEQKELEELPPSIEVMNPKTKKKEEWDEVETSLKLEFWKSHTIIKGDYHQGFAIQGWRGSMEDTMDSKSSIDTQVPNMFGVYDGHGGESCAKYCKNFLLQQLAKRPDLSTNTKTALADQFLSIDTDYNKSPPEPNAGSTATVLCVLPIDVEAREKSVKKSGVYAQTSSENPRFRKSQKISKKESTSDRLHKSIRKTASFRENKHEYKFFCASAGDSRAVLVYASGKVLPLSVDHNLRRKDELERIKAGEGEIRYDPEFNELLVYSAGAERGLNVTRTIGDKDFKPLVTAFPDVKEGFITKDAAYFVVASDGLWAQVQNEEVGRIMLEYGLTDGLKNIANLSNARGCFDNCTVVGIDVQKMTKTMELYLNAKEA